MISIRTNHQLRLKAFDLMQDMKIKNFSRQEAVDYLHDRFNIPMPALYSWYKGKYLPYGRKGKVVYIPEIFYVLGALLGDGCLYKWRTTNNYVILVGDQAFTSKYALRLTHCIGKKAKEYIDRSKNIYFVRTNNFELFSLFKKCRDNIGYLNNLLREYGDKASLLFLEGFFDAEGCVKVIKESSRHTPKICLDITNTNIGYLKLCKHILENCLAIEARFSMQKSILANRKTAYHLRIYKKQAVKRFFERIKTTKLKKEKIISLKNWLELDYSFPLLSAN